MAVLDKPHHPLIAEALNLAMQWCRGHVIDEASALTHAVKVATTIGEHIEHPPPELIASALLHDAPYFAPHSTDLDEILSARLNPTVRSIVRALEREHTAMDKSTEPNVDPADHWTLYASAADKIVAVGSILRRAARTDDAAVFWQRRAAFVGRVGYFTAYSAQAGPHLPASMRTELISVVDMASRATASYRKPEPR
jgi:hypothetical protein